VGVVLLALCAIAPDAVANTIAPRDPRSPNAANIDDVYKIVVVIAALIALTVNVALVFVVLRFRAGRGREPARVRGTPRAQARAAGATAVVALAVLVLGIVFSEKVRTVAASGPNGLQAASSQTAQRNLKLPAGGPGPLKIAVAGQQWLWRYTYPGGIFSYYELVVPVDTTVELSIDSTDVVHRWWIPSLGGKFDAVPGRINYTWFRANREGTYGGQSAAYSGQSYPVMRAAVKVVSVPVYRAWLDNQKRDIQKAQAAAAKLVAQTATPRAEAEQ
jgi:cytochrome c oxidase subunit 2